MSYGHKNSKDWQTQHFSAESVETHKGEVKNFVSKRIGIAQELCLSFKKE